MNSKQKTAFALLLVFTLGSFFTPVAFSQDFSISMNTPVVATPQEKLQALESTRFHFITLKQFHSTLFTVDPSNPANQISEDQAFILNTALNSFLTQAGREMLLLEALRQNRAVRLRFEVPQKSDEYQIIDNPDRPLAYQLKPVVRSVSTTIEIKPLLDQPVAFQITLKKGNEQYVYDVDWSGRITCITCLNVA